jgi:hypothetical protein
MTKLQTIVLAIVAFAVAGALYRFVPSVPELAMGAAALGSALVGWAKQHPEDAQKLAVRDPQKGGATLIMIVLAAVATFLGLSYAYPQTARAEDWQTISPGVYRSGPWVAHPNFALSAGQVNVKAALTDGLTSGQAIERVALMGGYGLTYHGDKLTIGAGLYPGTGISAKTPNAPQISLLLTLWDALAFGPGVQRVTYGSGVVAYQMLFTVGLNYAAGGTVSKVAPWFDKILSACASAATCGI